MKRHTQTVALLGLGGALLLSGAAQAQNSASPSASPAPGAMGGPPPALPGAMGGSPSGAPGGATDAGVVTNTETTETVTGTSPALLDDQGEGEALPNTGGEPWLMALGGSLIAGSAFLLRRKLS